MKLCTKFERNRTIRGGVIAICITLHTQTVSKHTEDNTVLSTLWNMIWRFRDCLGR